MFLKRGWYLLIIFSVVSLMLAKPVLAHDLQTDRNISAIFHVEPDDDPIVGQQSSFFFEFSDTTKKFQPTACNCTLSVLLGNRTVYSQPLFQGNSAPSLENASLSYVFPSTGDYKVKVTGTPLKKGAFQAFTLVYDVPVTRTASSAATASLSAELHSPLPTSSPVPASLSASSHKISKKVVAAAAVGTITLIGLIALFFFLKKKPTP